MNLFSVPISITSKPQALALVLGWVKEWRTANPSEHSENSDSRKVRKSDNQTVGISGSPSIPSFPKIVVTPNPEMVVAAQKDSEFLKALQAADLAIPDGIGIVWALRSLHKRKTVDDGKLKVGVEDRKSKIEKFDPSSTIHPLLPSSIIHHPLSDFHRLSGLDLMESLIGESAKNGWRVLLLGGRPGIAEKAAKKLMHQIRPGLAPQGRAFIQSINGPPDIDKANPAQLNSLISSINSYSPDLLFVAFGHGKQEKWLAANRHRLNAGVAMGVGGALDQIADPSLRPPAYINSIGLGWLYRLLREPWRWKRQLALVKFVGMVIKERLERLTG